MSIEEQELLRSLVNVKRKVESLKKDTITKQNVDSKSLESKDFLQGSSFEDYLSRRRLLLNQNKSTRTSKSTTSKISTRKAKRKRQEATMDRFHKFIEKVRSQTREEASGPKSTASTERFKGGIGDNKTDLEKEKGDANVNDDDDTWMVSKLNFRRHIDDSFRKDMNFELKASDYEVIDTSKVKNL